MTKEFIKEADEEFRSIISHAFLGCDTSDISKETWDLAINECVKYLSMVAKKEAIEWISVDEKLPDYGEKVLVFGEHRLSVNMGGAYIMIGERQDLKGTLLEKQADRHQDKNQFKSMSYVTHWMPLPQKPNTIYNDQKTK